MIRQAVETVLFTRNGAPAALVLFGFPCAEHQRGHDRFAGSMGFVGQPDEKAVALSRKIKPGSWFRRRASLLAPAPGVEVLTLGAFASAPERSQVAAIVGSPAHSDVYEGRLFGGMRNRTPLAIQEPFLDLVANSDMRLAAAFDDKDVLIGGGSMEANRVVHWLAGLFASGEARMLRDRRMVIFCDPQAGRDLAFVSMTWTAPSGYERHAMRCDRRDKREAA